tara:strand:- start:783 stop:896 length:114 start_codon:yes stop_codon:yes gene_type:complete
LNKKPVSNTYKKPVLYDLRTQNNGIVDEYNGKSKISE